VFIEFHAEEQLQRVNKSLDNLICLAKLSRFVADCAGNLSQKYASAAIAHKTGSNSRCYTVQEAINLHSLTHIIFN
jgi:hypothetical protein